uniref:Transglutaminase N-terminal domain-containing protein n=1 Tax=Timema genevievae TaxID=629358 RepID=A0A7R9PGF2_TIMGE|nr:unnamed protein product [Timema genevievae]
MSRRPKDDYYERYVYRMMTRFNEDYHRRVRGHVPSDPESEEETDKPARTHCLKPLKVSEVDTHPAKNSRESHTELYEIIHGYRPTAVLRRGFSFVLTLKFDREYEITKDIIKIKFGIGETFPIRLNTSVVIVPGYRPRDSGFKTPVPREFFSVKHWVWIGVKLSLVHISVSAPVGRWILMVETYHVQLEGTRNVTEKTDLYILFNPWHKDESVGAGMHPGGLDEYLLKDTGKVWRGTADSPEGRPWVFGQFHHVVLPAITLLLAKFDMPCDIRGDPIELVRALSSIVST